ncbi:MAG: HlyD family efflux transporter periplasmic adaptor subunit [Cyanobacteria bacterium SIG29]|nr:HlyD family efflux transporter periplasmic adaptor subunit [Cyanobacteria bacterium SIG29]
MIKKILDKIKNFFLYKENDAHEFEPILAEIEHNPINPLGPVIFWIVIVFIFSATAWMYFGKVDVVVTARGIIIPDGEQKIVKALDKGVVSSILVKEGDFVEENQVLAIISPAEHEPGLELNNVREEQAKVFEQISSTKTKLSIAKDRKQRLSKVLDIIPQNTYDEVVELVSSLSHELKALEASYSELNNKKEQLEKQIQTVKSPIDGYINNVKIHTVGGVVSPAEELMSVVPKDAKLTIKAKVMNQDVGFIDEGMDVSVKVDTFNFQKYGIIKGEVTVVGANSVEDERLGPVYDVYISPLNTTLLVEGKEQSIKTGMTTTNEINIGKRRIIEFFIYPLIKYLDESIKVR